MSGAGHALLRESESRPGNAPARGSWRVRSFITIACCVWGRLFVWAMFAREGDVFRPSRRCAAAPNTVRRNRARNRAVPDTARKPRLDGTSAPRSPRRGRVRSGFASTRDPVSGAERLRNVLQFDRGREIFRAMTDCLCERACSLQRIEWPMPSSAERLTTPCRRARPWARACSSVPRPLLAPGLSGCGRPAPEALSGNLTEPGARGRGPYHGP